MRRCWTEFCLTEAEKLNGNALLRIIPVLLGDARLIRNKIENQFAKLANEPRIKLVDDLCTQYKSLREKNLSPYSCKSFCFWDQNSSPPSRENIEAELQRVSKKLIKLQTEISKIGQSVKMNTEHGHPEQKVMLAKTQASLSAAWGKKQLAVSLEQLIIANQLQELSPMTSYN